MGFGNDRVETRGRELRVDNKIAGVVNRRSIGPQCRARVADRRKFGNLDLHAIRGIFSFRRRRRQYRRDRFADKTHDLIRQDWLFDRPIIVFVQHRLNRPCGEIGGANERDVVG